MGRARGRVDHSATGPHIDGPRQRYGRRGPRLGVRQIQPRGREAAVRSLVRRDASAELGPNWPSGCLQAFTSTVGSAAAKTGRPASVTSSGGGAVTTRCLTCPRWPAFQSRRRRLGAIPARRAADDRRTSRGKFLRHTGRIGPRPRLPLWRRMRFAHDDQRRHAPLPSRRRADGRVLAPQSHARQAQRHARRHLGGPHLWQADRAGRSVHRAANGVGRTPGDAQVAGRPQLRARHQPHGLPRVHREPVARPPARHDASARSVRTTSATKPGGGRAAPGSTMHAAVRRCCNRVGRWQT